jgi:hypothetical protein
MTLYGPKKLFLFVGVNKITPDLESAIYRARKWRRPKTPVASTFPPPAP